MVKADAGLGICIFVPGERPRVAYMEVPEPVRLLWRMQKDRSAKADIFEIEGVGPLAICCTWPDFIRGRPWIHFIDHQGAQMCLVRGSGNSRNGDLIAGLTWDRVRELDAWLWVDRVMSASNPIDGVSRKRFEGPWSGIEDAKLHRDLVRLLRQECIREGLL